MIWLQILLWKEYLINVFNYIFISPIQKKLGISVKCCFIVGPLIYFTFTWNFLIRVLNCDNYIKQCTVFVWYAEHFDIWLIIRLHRIYIHEWGRRENFNWDTL